MPDAADAAGPALRTAIREALGKVPGEPVTAGDLAGLESLSARNGGVRDLGANRVRHLQPLAGLERLRMLRLDGNRLSELRSLSRLNGLADLRLAGNTVENLGPIAGLEGLRRLDLRGNSVGDLRPLRGLPSLAWVHVGGSRIQDLAPSRRPRRADGGRA